MEKKQRHGCVTAVLLLMVLGSLITIYTNLLAHDIKIIATNLPSKMSTSMLYILAALSAIDIFFIVMLVKWKKYAFWGLVLTSIVAFIINLIAGQNAIYSLVGFLGILILFGVMQIKNNGVSAWKNLG